MTSLPRPVDFECVRVPAPQDWGPEPGVRVASDGYPLYFEHWPRLGTTRGTALLLHGIQSHSGWYRGTARRLAEAGHDVFLLDRRGSGRNTIARGHAVHADRLIHDVLHLLRDLHRRLASGELAGPVTLIGVSWGGKLATAVAAAYPELVQQLVLITPGLFPRIGPTFTQRLQLALARRLDIRDRRVPIPLNDPELFTTLPRQQEFIRHDPLALREVTLSFVYAGQDLDQRIREIKVLSQRCELLLAGDDRIIDNPRTERWWRSHTDLRAGLCEYGGVRHTLELDACRDDYLEDLVYWLAPA